MRSITVKSSRRTEFVDITGEIGAAIEESGVDYGVCHIFVPHTTAGITVNENADPSVMSDIAGTLERLVPRNGGYGHMEGNADAHVKATLVGSSKSLPIVDRRLGLGTWQGVFFCEFDGPRTRKVVVQCVRSKQ